MFTMEFLKSCFNSLYLVFLSVLGLLVVLNFYVVGGGWSSIVHFVFIVEHTMLIKFLNSIISVKSFEAFHWPALLLLFLLVVFLSCASQSLFSSVLFNFFINQPLFFKRCCYCLFATFFLIFYEFQFFFRSVPLPSNFIYSILFFILARNFLDPLIWVCTAFFSIYFFFLPDFLLSICAASDRYQTAYHIFIFPPGVWQYM